MKITEACGAPTCPPARIMHREGYRGLARDRLEVPSLLVLSCSSSCGKTAPPHAKAIEPSLLAYSNARTMHVTKRDRREDEQPQSASLSLAIGRNVSSTLSHKRCFGQYDSFGHRSNERRRGNRGYARQLRRYIALLRVIFPLPSTLSHNINQPGKRPVPQNIQST